MTECPICHKKCKNDNTYLDHLEKIHKNNDCGCDNVKKGGAPKKGQMFFKGADKEQMENFEKILKDARNKIEKIDSNMQMNAVKYGLKLGKKDIEKIPLPVREKIKSLLMENEYMKGVVKAQENQIKIMKKHIDKCIDSVGFHYVVKK